MEDYTAQGSQAYLVPNHWFVINGQALNTRSLLLEHRGEEPDPQGQTSNGYPWPQESHIHPRAELAL